MKRVLGSTMTLVALVAVGGLVVALRDPKVRVGGPVSPGAVINRSQPVDPGAEESVGYLLMNEGKVPAVLEQVRVLGITGPIEVLGVRASLHKGDRGSLLMLAGFPPPEYPAKPLAEEHVVPVPATFSDSGSPNEGLQLMVGIRAVGEGFGRINGIEVTYRVGEQRYRISNQGYGALCAPLKRFYNAEARATLEDCPSKQAAEVFDEKFVDFRVPDEGAS